MSSLVRRFREVSAVPEKSMLGEVSCPNGDVAGHVFRELRVLEPLLESRLVDAEVHRLLADADYPTMPREAGISGRPACSVLMTRRISSRAPGLFAAMPECTSLSDHVSPREKS